MAPAAGPVEGPVPGPTPPCERDVIEIGRGKSGREAYGLDDISIVPSRRTRDPEDVDISWEIDAYRFESPLMAAPTDSVVSPASAVEIGQLGGVAVLNLEGIWTRYEDPEPLLEEISRLDAGKATARMQEIYREPIKSELVTERIREINAAGVVSCASLTPQRTEQFAKALVDAELDLFVIHGTVVSAEHVSKSVEPLNLKRFIREFDIPVIVGGCASYQAALHLMRTGAVGVLVGVGPGSTSEVLGIGVPQATAIADARAARAAHLDETGVYVQVIAEGAMATGGDMAKAIVCGADAVMVGSPLAAAHEAPGRGFHWDPAAFHPSLPRGGRVPTVAQGSTREILGQLLGALRTSMATCGYESVKEFQKAEVVTAPAPRAL